MFVQLLPEGFALPPLPYLLVVLGGVALAVLALGLARPAVTEVTVLALTPWMVAGAGLNALYKAGVIADVVAPFFSAPTVYLTVFAVLGFVWGLASLVGRDPAFSTAMLTICGIGLMSAVLGLALVVGYTTPPLRLFWPAVGLVAAVVLAAVAWATLDHYDPEAVLTTGWAGALAVFAHALDGTSTAVGVDVLGFGEQTPLSAFIIHVGASLPTEPFLGSAWLFVLLKVALASFIVVLLADYVEEAPKEGFLLLAAVAAVGLGPGVHNLVLFAIAPSPTAAALVML